MSMQFGSRPPEIGDQPLLLPPKEAAARLRISERTLWTLTDRGEIRCIRIGAAKRYPMIELELFVARLLLEQNELDANSSTEAVVQSGNKLQH